MVMLMLTAFVTMACATLAVHLGLTQAIAEVVLKAAKCNQCATFWLTAGVLLLMGTRPDVAAAVAVFCAYISNWFVLVLVLMQSIYDWSWERLRRTKKTR